MLFVLVEHGGDIALALELGAKEKESNLGSGPVATSTGLLLGPHTVTLPPIATGILDAMLKAFS
jgi:hypothetical protein